MDASTFLRWWGFTTVDDHEVRRLIAERPAWARDVGPAFVVGESPPLRSLTDTATLELDFCRIDRVGQDVWWVRYGYPDFWQYDGEDELRVMGHHERQPDGSLRSTYFLRGRGFTRLVLLMILTPMFTPALLLLPGWWRLAAALVPAAAVGHIRMHLTSVVSAIAATHKRLATCPIPPLPALPVSEREWPRGRSASEGWF